VSCTANVTVPALLAAAVVILSGCMVVPHGERTMRGVEVPREATAAIEAGQTSREDVLHLLGRPDRVDEDGRFFFYQWTSSAATFFAIIGGYSAAYIVAAEIPSGTDSVCLEFSPAGELVRWARVHSDEVIKSYEKTAQGWKEAAEPMSLPAGGAP
jgi:outer membrane protein assembly factor BamE (lipoprotein component of BamABCDE complex)